MRIITKIIINNARHITYIYERFFTGIYMSSMPKILFNNQKHCLLGSCTLSQHSESFAQKSKKTTVDVDYFVRIETSTAESSVMHQMSNWMLILVVCSLNRNDRNLRMTSLNMAGFERNAISFCILHIGDVIRYSHYSATCQLRFWQPSNRRHPDWRQGNYLT